MSFEVFTNSGQQKLSPLQTKATYSKIFDQTLGASAANFDIQGIPTGFDHLRALTQLRSTSTSTYARIRLNNVSTNDYYTQELKVTSGTTVAGARVDNPSTSSVSGMCASSATGASYFLPTACDILNYTASHTQQGVAESIGPGPDFYSHRWAAVGVTAPVTRITLFPDVGEFAAGSRCTLYGLTSTETALSGDPPFKTSLPGSPTDGMEIVYEADAANKIYWRLKYQQSSSKWLKVGGPPMRTTLADGGWTTSASYVDMGSPVQLVAPLSGNYRVTFGANSLEEITSNWYMGIAVGAVAPTEFSEAVLAIGSAAHERQVIHRVFETRDVTGGGADIAASTVIKGQRKTNGGTSYFRSLYLEIDPIYVS